MFLLCRETNFLTSDDVVISDIESAGTNTVLFSLYVQSDVLGIVSGKALLMAIQVKKIYYLRSLYRSY